MKKIKNLLLATSIICFFATLINILYFIDGLSNPKNSMVIFVIYYILVIIASLISGIVFLQLYKDINNNFHKYKNIFKMFCIISLLCSLLGGILACYAFYLISTLQNSKNTTANSIEVDGMEIIEDKRMAKYIDDLNRLEEMRNSGIISQEKYEILKNQILSKYVKGE